VSTCRIRGILQAGGGGRIGLGIVLAVVVTLGQPWPTPVAHAATFMVNSTLDEHDGTPGDGLCRSTPSSLCTLRAAIEEANRVPTPDLIDVPAETFTTGLGELVVTSTMRIAGAGAERTIIQAAPEPYVAGHRVLRVEGLEDSSIEVAVGRLTIQHGSPPGPFDTDNSGTGGGILLGRFAALELESVRIHKNRGNRGGGIAILAGTGVGTKLALRDSVLSENVASVVGAALRCSNLYDPLNSPPHSRLPSWQIVTSSIVQNSASIDGGLSSLGCNGVIERSVVARNTSTDGAGGLRLQFAEFRLTNTTVTENVARRPSPTSNPAFFPVGGVDFSTDSGGRGRLLMESVTVAENQTINGPPGSGANLLLHFAANGSSPTDAVRMMNTIVAQRSATTVNCRFSAPPSATVMSLGGNVEFPGDSCRLTLASGAPEDSINVNPSLQPLADNGGPTLTMALPAGSVAVDRAQVSRCPSVDQRGQPRPRDGNGDGVARCDSGAFERDR
jgi:CSLREA domain-containing protein